MDIAPHGLENVGHRRLHSSRYRKSGSAAIRKDAQQGAADAILSNDVFLREIAITHLCHVAYMNHSAAHHFDRQIVQQIDPWRIDVEINRHFFSADLGRAAWIGKRAIADGSDDIGFDEVIGFQRLEVEIDGDHPLLSAIWVGNADSGYTDQSDANLV